MCVHTQTNDGKRVCVCVYNGTVGPTEVRGLLNCLIVFDVVNFGRVDIVDMVILKNNCV